MNHPFVSVVMAAYNEQESLTDALNSVAAQSYEPIEIICINDGSRDGTQRVLTSWQTRHPHIPVTILVNPTNRGLAASLNRGIAAAKGTYIARIDADDIWHPEKIEKQMLFADSHPNCGVIGTWYVNRRGSATRTIKLPVTNGEIKRSMFRRNPFGHSCVVMRTDVVRSVAGYREQLREDRDLWFRLLHRTTFYNIPEVLVYRNISASHFTSPKELKRNIQTAHTYMRQYKVSPLTYIWLLEPIAVYLYHTVRRYVR